MCFFCSLFQSTSKKKQPCIAASATTLSSGGTYHSGDVITLSVTATGTNLKYQWLHKGNPIVGATNSTYKFTVADATVGDYQVAISNECSHILSSQVYIFKYINFTTTTTHSTTSSTTHSTTTSSSTTTTSTTSTSTTSTTTLFPPTTTTTTTTTTLFPPITTTTSSTTTTTSTSTTSTSTTSTTTTTLVPDPPATRFGVDSANDSTSMTKLSTAISLNVAIMRMTAEVSSYSGSLPQFDLWTANGIDIFLNLLNINGGGTPVALPTDLTAYATKITQILTDYKPLVAVIENEEGNPAYYDSSFTAEKYLNMLNIATSIAHTKGVRITNGGLITSVLHGLVYRWINTNEGAIAANSYLTNNVPTYLQSVVKLANNSTYEQAISTYIALIAGYASSDIDYINFHNYEPNNSSGYADNSITSPTPDTINRITQYLYTMTGKPVITNETGQKNNNGTLTVNMMNLYKLNSFPYVVWYDGDGIAAYSVGLTDTSGTKRPSGLAFANYLA